MKKLQWVVPKQYRSGESLKSFLVANPEIRFVSLAGVDFLGNDTDERIPVRHFIENMENIFSGGIQTDGSSVNLPGIATLSDAKIDFIIDTSARWFVDHNYDSLMDDGKPVGTLRIPIFFKHHEKMCCSRSVLKKSCEYVEREFLKLFEDHPTLLPENIKVEDIKKIQYTLGTELEFWVRTTLDDVPARELEVSQMLKESYWKRTKGQVRTCLEKALEMLENYGFEPEMGHKEVGGIKGTISPTGKLSNVMEQMEINWRFSDPITACDNELFARIIIKEVFRRHGLEVTVMAKPVDGVAGNGEHMHVGIIAELKNGGKINLFAPEKQELFLSRFGYGSLMGVLKNWGVINPFVSHSNSALKRLKPGFEAPVSVAASLGASPENPSRNRSVLVGLVRGDNPLSVRFEVRAPNPHTNSYLAMSSFLIAMLDGVKYSASKSGEELDREIHKNQGDDADYLENNRIYICEKDLFEEFSAYERELLFGKSPSTVYEVISEIETMPELYKGSPLSSAVVRSFYLSALRKWEIELMEKEIPEIRNDIRSIKRMIVGENEFDVRNWESVESIKNLIAKDGLAQKSLITRLKEALNKEDYAKASSLFLELQRVFCELKEAWGIYRSNII